MDNFKTRDLYLAALLISHNGFKLIGSEKKTDGVYFEVETKNQKLFQALIEKFNNYTATVNLIKLKKSLSILRRELDKHRI